VLFRGYITQIRLDTKAGYGELSVELADTSYLLDIRRQNKTYQNLGKSYGDILNDAYHGAGKAVVNVTDQPIGAFILQMDETNWDFSKRMASRFNVPIFSNLVAEKPMVSLGVPPGKQASELSTAAIRYTTDNGRFREVTGNDLTEGHKAAAQDFNSLYVDSYDYAYLGDKVRVNGKDYYVWAVHAKLLDGLMRMNYELTGRQGFVVPWVRNNNCAGRVIKSKRKSGDRSDCRELKMTCIDGALKYLRDKKYGYADVHIISQPPKLPYRLTGFTHNGEEIDLIDGMAGISHGELSRNMDNLTLMLYLKDEDGNNRYNFTYTCTQAEFEPKTQEEIEAIYGDHIPQDDTDNIINREAKFFIWSEPKEWGFMIVPVYREGETLMLGKEKFASEQISAGYGNYNEKNNVDDYVNSIAGESADVNIAAGGQVGISSWNGAPVSTEVGVTTGAGVSVDFRETKRIFNIYS